MRLLKFLAAALLLAAACGDPFGLPDAVIENRVDTLTLYALSGTPVTQPSGYTISLRGPVRTDQALDGFDFAFDIDTAGRALLLPTGALGLGRTVGKSGIQRTTAKFDSIRVAPTNNYQLDSAVVVDSNAVVLLHSRPTGCSFSLTAQFLFYAKLHVLEIDTTSDGRSIKFEILTDINCGYRGLEPGLPKH